MNGRMLPIDKGPLTVRGDGVVIISPADGIRRAAYPFAQPQPFFEREESDGLVTLTTNGVSLMRAAMGDVSRPVLVRASLDLLCALLITPDAMTLEDVADFRTGNEGRLIMAIDRRARFGLIEGSYIVFHHSYDGIGTFDPSLLEEELPYRY